MNHFIFHYRKRLRSGLLATASSFTLKQLVTFNQVSVSALLKNEEAGYLDRDCFCLKKKKCFHPEKVIMFGINMHESNEIPP